MKAEIDRKIDEKRIEIENVTKMWADEIAVGVKTPSFDENSKKAQTFFKKVAKKFASTLNELNDEMAELQSKKQKESIK